MPKTSSPSPFVPKSGTIVYMEIRERQTIQYLLKDPYVDYTTLGPHRIFCRGCGERIHGQSRFDQGSWIAHKTSCNHVRPDSLPSRHTLYEALLASDLLADKKERELGRGIYHTQIISLISKKGYDVLGRRFIDKPKPDGSDSQDPHMLPSAPSSPHRYYPYPTPRVVSSPRRTIPLLPNDMPVALTPSKSKDQLHAELFPGKDEGCVKSRFGSESPRRRGRGF